MNEESVAYRLASLVRDVQNRRSEYFHEAGRSTAIDLQNALARMQGFEDALLCMGIEYQFQLGPDNQEEILYIFGRTIKI